MDFDFDRAKFDLPMHSLLRYILEVIKGGTTPVYPFSKEEDRAEFSRDYVSHISAVVLQEALAKAKLFASEFDSLINKGACTLYKGKASPLVEAQFQGFLQDLLIDLSDFDPHELVDDIEELLYKHAKFNHIGLKEAVESLEKVNLEIFHFTLRTESSNSKYEKEGSPIIRLMRKSEGSILIPY